MKTIDVVAEKLRQERRFFFEQMRQEPQRRLEYWQRLRDKRKIQGDVRCPDCPLALADEHDLASQNRKAMTEVM